MTGPEDPITAGRPGERRPDGTARGSQPSPDAPRSPYAPSTGSAPRPERAVGRDATGGPGGDRGPEPGGVGRPRPADAPTETLALGDVPRRSPATQGSLREPAAVDRERKSALPPRVPGAPARSDARPVRSSRRRARLTLRRIDPWSVFTTSLIVSLFLGVVLLVAVAVLYALLDSVGVLSSVNDALSTIGVTDKGAEFVGLGQVLGITAVIAAVDVVLVTVLATLFAFLYNVVASLTGGIVLTLSEGE